MAASADADLDVNLTPLLDLVLQLIMFFMITVNFVRVDQFDESIKLPVAASAVPIDNTAEKWVFLNLDSKGQLAGQLSNQHLDTPGKIEAYLRLQKERLERLSAQEGNRNPKIVVILRSDRYSKYKDVWQVLDSCQRAGFNHWQLRVMTRAAGG